MPLYKKISKNIQEITIDGQNDKKIRWINITNPGKEELEYLMRFKEYKFDFKQLRASSAKIMSERPIIEQKDGYCFIILQFPIFNGNEIVASEIDFFIGHGLLITLHNGNIKVLEEFFNTCRKGDNSTLTKDFPSSAILLYEIINKLIYYCYEIMDQNNSKISNVEKFIFSSEQKKAVSKILELRQNIINIRRILVNHKNILKKMMEMKSSLIPTSKIKDCYYELIEHTKRIWEFSESQREAIEALNSTNESLMNDQTNNIMRTLTIFSVIVLPLNLIAGIFGMNTVDGMPFINNPYGFSVVISIMTIGCLSMIIFFIKKKWL